MSAPIVKYKTGGYDNPIERVECVRETKAFVVIMQQPLFGDGPAIERREGKKTDWDCYHDTWEEARDWLVMQRERAIESAQVAISSASEKIDRARDEIAIIKGWANPELAASNKESEAAK